MPDLPQNSPSRRPRLLRTFARIFLIAARWAIVLALVGIAAIEAFAWTCPQDFGDTSMPYLRFAAVAFFTRVFQLHIGLIVVALALLALAARAWRTAGLASMLAFALLLPFAREYAPKHPPAAGSPTLRLMSMNLYYLNRDGDAIVAAIRAANPDVIVMAEVTPWSKQALILGSLRQSYPYLVASRFDGGADVISRVPLRVGRSPVRPSDREARTPVLFDVGGQEVALYPVHLVSPGHWWLVGHNREQVASFAEVAAAETRPMIIAGDFNFTPLTPNFARLRVAGLRTTHELVGTGIGNTWGPRWWPDVNRLPGVRIDHIFMSRALTATHHEVGLDTGSDHRPIVADIAIAVD